MRPFLPNCTLRMPLESLRVLDDLMTVRVSLQKIRKKGDEMLINEDYSDSASMDYLVCVLRYWSLKSIFNSTQRGRWSDIWKVRHLLVKYFSSFLVLLVSLSKAAW